MAYHLISIGIAAYSNPANNLDFPDDDAGELSAIMRHSLGSELTYDVLLRDNEATQIGIRTALGVGELKNATTSDTLIVYYSGHGALVQSGSDAEAYLAPYDVSGNIAISGISTSEVKAILDDLKHGNKIMLLDCCYSGGANTKSITRIKHKDLATIKAFQNQSYAEGTFVFTACKEDETAIEVPDLKHGLFTYQLIEELVKGTGDTIALSSIHDPVTKAVELTAQKYSHKQTPTIQLNSKGSMSLPKLSKPPALKPEIIKVPTIQGAKPPTVSAPLIDISDKKTQELVQASIKLVEGAMSTKLGQIAFRSTLGKILAVSKDTHAAQAKQVSSADQLAALLTSLEAKSFQVMVTAAVVSVAGNEQTLKLFCEEAAEILIWKRGQSGLVAAIETSDVIFLAVLYIVSVCSIYADDYMPIGKLLNTSVYDPYSGHGGSYNPVIKHYGIHYADALGGNAKNVMSHMIELLTSQEWLLELLGVDKEKLTSLIIQANLCLCVAMSRHGERTYPGYNDFDLVNLAPLVNRIRTDSETQASIAKHLLDVKQDEVTQAFEDEVTKINHASGNHWWSYLNPKTFTQDTALEKD
jgi:hypothetical protein